MGTGAFIFASNFSGQGIFGTGLIGPGAFLLCVILRAQSEIRYRCKNGRWTKEGDKSRVLKPDGKILWKSLIPLTANVLTNLLYLLAMTIGWKLAKAGNINQGVISTLLSLASVINMVLFYCKFGEKVSGLHMIGVFLMIACIVCISLEATS